MRPDNVAFDGQFEIPALGEVIELARRLGVGIYPETKHPPTTARSGWSSSRG